MYERTGLSCKDEGNITERLKEKLQELPKGLLLKSPLLNGTLPSSTSSNNLSLNNTLQTTDKNTNLAKQYFS